jgi:hypothetical protein
MPNPRSSLQSHSPIDGLQSVFFITTHFDQLDQVTCYLTAIQEVAHMTNLHFTKNDLVFDKEKFCVHIEQMGDLASKCVGNNDCTATLGEHGIRAVTRVIPLSGSL